MSKQKTPKLKFGNQESIDTVKEYNLKKIEEKLAKRVKCPFCGAKNIGCFEFYKVYDSDEHLFGWNFDCKPSCPNSLESLNSGDCDGAKLFTDKNGSFEKAEVMF